jgi:tRNA(Ile)-lysidine synthetase-like protein
MMRDELLQQISALPPDTDIGIQIGNDHLDIEDIVPWGDGGFIALSCHSRDLRDLLLEWGIPENSRKRIVPDGCGE